VALSWNVAQVAHVALASPEAGPPVCQCGSLLLLRVVGVGQRWGGEPISAASCWHCQRCGDVKGHVGPRQSGSN
jgi:hypothetical protein